MGGGDDWHSMGGGLAQYGGVMTGTVWGGTGTVWGGG